MALCIKRTVFQAAISLSVVFASSGAAMAQVAGADQGIFNDEQQMLQLNNMQVRQAEKEKMMAERDLEMHEQKDGPYRLYVQKTIKELSKPGAKGGDRLATMQDWLKRDDQYRAAKQAQIQRLDQQVQQLQQTQNQTVSNLQSDIVSMRQNVQDQKDAAKFDRMMRVNYFNELQSEMGAASWGTPPQDGTFNSTGGYGMMGGYGMGAFGRQSGRYGRW